jgi:hypothetical protein
METTTEQNQTQSNALPSNVIPIRKTLAQIADEKGVSAALDFAEERLQKAETILLNVQENHELFMQGLEDAARECLKNDLIRVTIPKVFRDKLSNYVELREKARQQNAVQTKE